MDLFARVDYYGQMNKSRFFRHILLLVLLLIILVTLVTGYCRALRPNPKGTNYQSDLYPIKAYDVDFLHDLTYMSEKEEIISEQEIFDRIFTLIESAQKYILLDMFLFNSYLGKAEKTYRNLAAQLTSHLINKKIHNPDIEIDFITDPVNTVYGGSRSEELSALKEAGINVILTDLKRLRDSNVFYSPIWRLFIQWFGNSDGGGIFPHPFSDQAKGVTLRSYLDMLNFKANHRKIFLADYHNEYISVVTSANPHDGSSAHSNVAFEIKGAFARELYKAEMAVAELSGGRLNGPDFADIKVLEKDMNDIIHVQLLTEEKIDDALMSCIDTTGKGDNIKMGIFYLCKRNIVTALLRAAARGVNIRLILDPNKDAFGRNKAGIPNRQVASELMSKSKGSIRLRWYDTHGEQFHTKLSFFDYQDKSSVIILGSANFTRRNLANYNLELNVKLVAPATNRIVQEVNQYFERIWGDNKYTATYSKYEDNSCIKKIWYRILEATGFSTF